MAAAKPGKEAKMVKRRRAAGEDDTVETALAAAAAALFVSGMKTLLQGVLGGQWPGFVVVGPSPLLFLLLQLVIACIVFVSAHPAKAKPVVDGKRKPGGRSSASRKEASQGKRRLQQHQQPQPQQHQQPQPQQHRACRRCREQRDEGEAEKEEWGVDGGCTAEELNARAEAFISAFRQHLKLDSISSNTRCGRRAASFRY